MAIKEFEDKSLKGLLENKLIKKLLSINKNYDKVYRKKNRSRHRQGRD